MITWRHDNIIRGDDKHTTQNGALGNIILVWTSAKPLVLHKWSTLGLYKIYCMHSWITGMFVPVHNYCFHYNNWPEYLYLWDCVLPAQKQNRLLLWREQQRHMKSGLNLRIHTESFPSMTWPTLVKHEINLINYLKWGKYI